jgi:hypothetical protein
MVASATSATARIRLTGDGEAAKKRDDQHDESQDALPFQP